MNFRKVIKIMMVVALITAVVGCSATPTRRSFKEGWKDSVVSTKVKMKLTSDKLVKKRNIDVDTWRGVVTMTGRVTSMEEKERAEQLAWQAKGVRGVDNFLKLVDDASLETGELVAEETLTETDEAIITVGSGEKIVDTETIVATETVKVKKPASHPMKSKSTKPATVSNKVEGPIVYEEKVKTKRNYTAKRTSKYNKPQMSQIQEEDLTDEDMLAREAAEELRRLRGEE